MPTAITSEAPHRPHGASGAALHGPWADVLLLGGASVVAWLVLRALSLDMQGLVTLGLVMMVLAHLVNHPHFAHSYQLFYGSAHPLNGGVLPPGLRQRWWLVGVLAPALLAGGLGWAALRAIGGDPAGLAVALNLMGLLVGWHYVKQGFGMAMMDAALKRRFWAPDERRALLLNAYAVWACAWLMMNDRFAGSTYFGYERFAFDLPDAAVAAAVAVVALSTAWVIVVAVRAARRWRAESPDWATWPVAGGLAYGVSLYLWTLFVWQDPAYVLVVPFFHSLQYLAVVWRLQSNRVRAQAVAAPARSSTRRALARFAGAGVMLGFAGFWLIPGVLEWAVTGRVTTSQAQTAPIVAAVWIFINIHHYLIDSVLWRQGNPVVSRHLFGAGRA